MIKISRTELGNWQVVTGRKNQAKGLYFSASLVGVCRICFRLAQKEVDEIIFQIRFRKHIRNIKRMQLDKRRKAWYNKVQVENEGRKGIMKEEEAVKFLTEFFDNEVTYALLFLDIRKFFFCFVLYLISLNFLPLQALGDFYSGYFQQPEKNKGVNAMGERAPPARG